MFFEPKIGMFVNDSSVDKSQRSSFQVWAKVFSWVSCVSIHYLSIYFSLSISNMFLEPKTLLPERRELVKKSKVKNNEEAFPIVIITRRNYSNDLGFQMFLRWLT